MKFVRFLGLAVIMTGVLCSAFAADDNDGIRIRYVKVTEAFGNVRENLDPKSDIIRQVHMGDYLELVQEGESGSWYRVKVDGKVGYLEAKAGKVVNKKSAQTTMLLLFVALIAACAVAVVFYIKRQQQPQAAGVRRGGLDIDDDDGDDDDLPPPRKRGRGFDDDDDD